MPFCQLKLRAKKPRPGYPAEPRTLGEQLKKWRLDRGLRQVELARLLGVDEMTVVYWERGKHRPRVSHLPGIHRLIGAPPADVGGSLAERLIALRRRMGWSQEELARRLGVDPESVARWERGTIPSRKYFELIENLWIAHQRPGH